MDQHVPSTTSAWWAAVAAFALAVFLRMPSCYESFWLDELHSAWVIWDGLAEVYPRSVIGHQSPIYFYILWFWKQIVGESEMLLRLSSVIPVALSCSLITVAVARWCNSIPAGLTGGAVLAVENNSLFFGTELRPYGFIILCASVATISFVKMWSTESRHQQPKTWCILIASIILGAIIQPTSLGVLAWLPAALLGRWFLVDRRKLASVTPLDGLSALSIVLAAVWLWRITLQESWQQKSIWAAFGSATDPHQILQAWNWTWLLAVPLILLLIGFFVRWRLTELKLDPSHSVCLLMLAALAFGTTCLYWIGSRLELAPIWHRRYFVAVIPLLAVICGGCVGYLQHSIPKSRIGLPVGCLGALILIAGIGFGQRTIQQLTRYPVALVVRGEDWRGAIKWIAEHSTVDDRVLVDAGLIEGHAWIRADLLLAENELKRDYLTLPASGPYFTGRQQFPVGSDLLPIEDAPEKNTVDPRPVFILTRRSAARVPARNPSD
ncbi:MAG: hypothetical protein ACR2NZ_25025, partial [Rubripirellula sp.]